MTSTQNKKLHDHLLGLDIIAEGDLVLALEKAEKNNKTLEEILINSDLISNKILGKVIADFLETPYIFLAETAINSDVLKTLPEVYAQQQLVIAFKKDKKGLHIATNNPTDNRIKKAIEKKTGLPVKTYFATKRDIENTLGQYNKEVGKVFDEIIEEHVKKAQTAKGIEPPIIKIVETIISYAYQNKASDIHIEPTSDYSLVRFRIDGVLHDIVQLPVNLHPPIVTRVKVLSNLRTDEHQKAQDGKIIFKTKQEELDLRVSIVPITNGENVVLRLLSERSRQSSLPDLGLSEAALEKVKEAYKKPHGMILSTGPTGSGKTTTLYAILKIINRRDINIMTIEDPVEYDIENINQIQVNTKTELTFAKGLRSIVRQDPDIILVGEIRDEETASIAINAAMTGHLVLSTLHTNDSATTFPRLVDMEVEPYLVASSINVVIGQRLVRKICVNCRVSTELDVSTMSAEVQARFEGKDTIKAYKGKGCQVCHHTGYQGRIGIFEVLLVDDQIREAVTNKKNAEEIKKIAIANGMKTMMDDGVAKVKQGITTMDEVLRVTKE